MCCLSEENHFTLRSQCAKAGVLRLVKKMDQSRAVAVAGHLFWSGKPLEEHGKEVILSRQVSMKQSPLPLPPRLQLRDHKKLISCLDKSEKLASDCVEVAMKAQLLIELLSRTLYFFPMDPVNVGRCVALCSVCDVVFVSSADPSVATELADHENP